LAQALANTTHSNSELLANYHLYLVSSDLIELRNLITTAQITVESAISRTESRGLHYNEDYPSTST
jgi:L-aspartate oxidase